LVQSADEREDGCVAVGWNLHTEAALPLVDRLTESFLGILALH
jgi:hypothetical protein